MSNLLKLLINNVMAPSLVGYKTKSQLTHYKIYIIFAFNLR